MVAVVRVLVNKGDQANKFIYQDEIALPYKVIIRNNKKEPPKATAAVCLWEDAAAGCIVGVLVVFAIQATIAVTVAATANDDDVLKF